MAEDSNSSAESGVQDLSLRENTEDESSPEFRFITFQDPSVVRSRSIQGVIRAHGVKKSTEERRKKLSEGPRGYHFRHFSIDRLQQASSKRTHNPKASINSQKLDPFQSLAIDSSRLQVLMRNSI